MPGAPASTPAASARSWQVRPSMGTLTSPLSGEANESEPPTTRSVGSATVANPPGTTRRRMVSLRRSCGPASTSSATACHAWRVGAIQDVTATSMADYDAVMISMQQDEGQDQGFDPRTGEPVGQPVPHTGSADVDRAARAAAEAAPALAELLRGVAAALEAARDELVPLADAETGLGEARLSGELTRTTVQLEMFADLVAEGSFLEVIIDHADASARPAPRPDLRRMLVPIGPVAVFGAGNFPFAFSVAGGDTASAVAAGCPVVVKAHPGHPGLSVRTGQILAAALPAGAFGMVHGLAAGQEL